MVYKILETYKTTNQYYYSSGMWLVEYESLTSNLWTRLFGKKKVYFEMVKSIIDGGFQIKERNDIVTVRPTDGILDPPMSWLFVNSTVVRPISLPHLPIRPYYIQKVTLQEYASKNGDVIFNHMIDAYIYGNTQEIEEKM